MKIDESRESQSPISVPFGGSVELNRHLSVLSGVDYRMFWPTKADRMDLEKMEQSSRLGDRLWYNRDTSG